MYKLLIAILITTLFISCFEEDQRVTPYSGHSKTINQDIEKLQVYFDLETDSVVKYDSANLWQLGFECDPEGWHIITNSGDSWMLYNTHQNDLSTTVSIPVSYLGLYDAPSSYPDSTACGNWLNDPSDGTSSKKEVYLLGKINGINYAEVRKIIFLSVNESTYRFYFEDAASQTGDTVTITKIDSVNFVYYSFRKNTQLNLEPEKTTYDLVFGPYFDMATLFNETIPYLVRGVFINTSNTTATLDTQHDYYNITLETLSGYNLTNQRNVIGYNWKDPIVDQGTGESSYYVKLNFNYLIRTVEGNYYKLRFISFDKEHYTTFEFDYLGRD